MKNVLTAALVLSVFVLCIAGMGDRAEAQGCFVRVCKSAPQFPPPQSEGELIGFDFIVDYGDLIESIEIFANLEMCPVFSFASILHVVEEERIGWELDGIDCDLEGVDVSFVENGVDFDCVVGTNEDVNGTCTFVNLRNSENIPTLSEWGMIAAAAGLALIGAFYAMRRKRASA